MLITSFCALIAFAHTKRECPGAAQYCASEDSTINGGMWDGGWGMGDEKEGSGARDRGSGGMGEGGEEGRSPDRPAEAIPKEWHRLEVEAFFHNVPHSSGASHYC